MGRAVGVAMVMMAALAYQPVGAQQAPRRDRVVDMHPALPPESQELADAARGTLRAEIPVRPAMAEQPALQTTPPTGRCMLVAFASGSAQLTPTVTRRLDAFGRALLAEATAESHFRVEGYADTTGSRDANRDLAARRARAVAGYLETVGVPAERLEVAVSPGLLVPTSDHTASAANRRVRIVPEG